MTKKIILSFAALQFFRAMSQVRLGVKGGWNLSTISVDNDGSVDKDQSLSGYHVGLIADFPLSAEDPVFPARGVLYY